MQRGFADYPLLPLAPRQLEVLIVPSERDPVGCGEMGIPTVAPALANAIFNACGVRVRRLPLKDQVRELPAARPAGRTAPLGSPLSSPRSQPSLAVFNRSLS